MVIVEYKLNIDRNGMVYHPPYIKKHAFYDTTTKTYLGAVLPESERDYWVPDTLVEMSLDQAIVRCVEGTVDRILAPGTTPLTDEELTQIVQEWYTQNTES
jgi:hypothetical protein